VLQGVCVTPSRVYVADAARPLLHELDRKPSAAQAAYEQLLLGARAAAGTAEEEEDTEEGRERQRKLDAARLRKDAERAMDYALPAVKLGSGAGQMPSF
jgi:hypothetical protein